jgi:hypothetical protein
MTKTQYRKALQQVGLSHRAAGAFFEVNPRTAERWAQKGVSGPAERFLKYMLASRTSAVDVELTIVRAKQGETNA